MKFRVSFKDPDTFDDAVRDAVKAELDRSGLDADETEALIDVRMAKVQKAIGHFVEYGEYIHIEFDTEARTATVIPR